MNRAAAAAAVGSGMGCRPLFTASQFQELEHQALIFKYLIAGIPVPPELLVPIRRNYESMAASFYSRPSLSYCSFYGKKVDPEPGRCRRTDGKKWRCSKDAYQDSKYCERHMHRGRNRSRKHVETSPAITQPHSSSSTETSLVPSSAGRSASAAPAAGGGSFHGLAFRSMGAAPFAPSQVQIDPASYGMPAIGAAMELRCLPESRPELDKCSFFSEAFGSLWAPSMSSSFDNSWRPTPSSPPISSFSLAKETNDSFLRSNNRLLQLQPVQSSSYRHPQHSFFGSELSPLEQPVRSVQPLLPFFDEWPGTRDAWSDLEDEREGQASSAATRLSISIPMASSDFSTTTSLSQNDD